eukprot:SAG11_NODE_8113_length_1059_cov_0.745833_2_plen_138_part_01
METWNRYLLTEIYILCHACSCQEISRVGTPGQGGAGGPGAHGDGGAGGAAASAAPLGSDGLPQLGGRCVPDLWAFDTEEREWRRQGVQTTAGLGGLSESAQHPGLAPAAPRCGGRLLVAPAKLGGGHRGAELRIQVGL